MSPRPDLDRTRNLTLCQVERGRGSGAVGGSRGPLRVPASPRLAGRRWGGARGGVAALLALALLLMTVGGASAHANLERSTPNANAVVVEQPKQLFLFFSEEPELRLTEVQLLDPTGKLI